MFRLITPLYCIRSADGRLGQASRPGTPYPERGRFLCRSLYREPGSLHRQLRCDEPATVGS